MDLRPMEPDTNFVQYVQWPSKADIITGSASTKDENRCGELNADHALYKTKGRRVDMLRRVCGAVE
jgi:hypothetical protein